MTSSILTRSVAAITTGIALGIPAAAMTAQAAPAPHPTTTVRTTAARAATVNITAVQTNLTKLGYYHGAITGRVDPATTASVKAFQKAHGWYPNGVINAKLATYLASAARATGRLPRAIDARCLTGGRVICADKTTRRLYYLVDNKLVLTADVRFGRAALPTREGVFHVYRMGRNWMSSEYHVLMPYSMFFSGGEAVHYSADFAANGYGIGSHGCVNMRSRAQAAYLFDHTHIGDKVVVYRSR